MINKAECVDILCEGEHKMKSETERREHLRQRIRDAFRDVPYPGDGNIMYDGPDPELVQMTFEGRHWKELSNEDLVIQSSSICVMTPEAFHFYLPAFLLASLGPPEVADFVLTAIEYMLLEPAPKGSWLFEDAQLLDREQRAAIREFLEFFRDLEGDSFGEIETALRTRWQEP